MKKILIVFLCTIVLFTGCVATSEEYTSESTTETETVETTREIRGKIVDKYYEEDTPILELKEEYDVEKFDASAYDDFDLLETGAIIKAETDSDNIIKIIEVTEDKDEEETVEENTSSEGTTIINPQQPENLSAYNKYKSIDLEFFPEYGINEIAIYTDAQRDENGDFLWDDGNEFVLVAHGENGDYPLYNKRVQIGSIVVNVFTADDVLTVTLLEYETAGISFRTYELIDNNFVETVEYKGEGNINMLSGF